MTDDIHKHRNAIDPRCRIGVCSMNNCLFPWCCGEGFEREETDKTREARQDFYEEIGRIGEVWAGGKVIGTDAILSVARDQGKSTAVRGVGAEGRPKGRHVTTWIIDDPVTTYTTSSRVLAGTGIYEDLVRRNNERVAQERRASSRANLLDSVSTKALRNIR